MRIIRLVIAAALLATVSTLGATAAEAAAPSQVVNIQANGWQW